MKQTWKKSQRTEKFENSHLNNKETHLEHSQKIKC